MQPAEARSAPSGRARRRGQSPAARRFVQPDDVLCVAVRRCSLGVVLGAEVLQAKEDGDQNEHHDEERFVVAAALLIGVFELCQKRLPILC